MENENLFELMSKIYSELTNLKFETTNRFDSLHSDVKDIKSQSDKNSLILEKIQTDVKILAEVQSSFSEQLDRAKDKEGKTLGERLDIIELAVTNTAKSVTELIDTIDVIKDTTGSHEMDIKILKKLQHTSFI